MVDLKREPVRKIPLPYAGDPWAQPGSQAPIPSSVPRLVVTGPLRWRVIPYDGVGPSAAPVDGDASTVDMCVVKITTDRTGAETLSRTVTLFESGGELVRVGEDITETDVSNAEVVVLSFVSVVQDTAAALWVFADSGATTVGT